MVKRNHNEQITHKVYQLMTTNENNANDVNPFEPESVEEVTETTVIANENWVNVTDTTTHADGSVSQTTEIISNKG